MFQHSILVLFISMLFQSIFAKYFLMKVVSYNCRELPNNASKLHHRPCVMDILNNDDIDIVCLEETWFRKVEGTGVQNYLLPFRNLGNFVHPTLPVSFGRDTKSRWSLLSGVYARGSKRPHTGKWKKLVVDSTWSW